MVLLPSSEGLWFRRSHPRNPRALAYRSSASKRITLRAPESRRAVALADLAAQIWRLSEGMVCWQRIVRALCGEGPLHYSCAGIAQPKLENRTKNLGLRLCSDQSRFGRSVLIAARLTATGLPLAGFLTGRRTRFHLVWQTAMYSAT